MIRFLSSALLLGAALTMSGCNPSSESKTTDTKKIESPSGTTTIETERKVETTGTNPPAARP